MAMLTALCTLRSKEALFCLHVDHSLRPESAADAEFVAAFCEKQGIQCRIVTIPPGKITRYAKKKGTGIEAAARFFRRKALLKEAARLGGNVLILTAHTKDDLLETALMRILRGCGPAGLALMPVKKGVFLRPLLSATRADITAYLKAKNIRWREDSTNIDESFLRNKIRRRLIPLFNEAFPSWKNGLFNMAQTQSLTADFISMEAKLRVIWGMGNRERGIGNRDWGLGNRERRIGNRDWGLGNRDCCSNNNDACDINSDNSDTDPSPRSPVPGPHNACDINSDNSDTDPSPQSPVPSPQSPVPSPSLLFTDAENFFTQPLIIREEALFQGIDRLLAGRENESAVRRAVVRRFCAEETAVVDLGFVRVRRENGKVVLAVRKKECFESGFSLLIKRSGLYKLKKISIKVQQSFTDRLFSQRNEEGVFTAALPLVFRQSFKEDFIIINGRKIKGGKTRGSIAKKTISAVDVFGTAAFIDSRGLIAARDGFENEREFFDIKISSNKSGGCDDRS